MHIHTRPLSTIDHGQNEAEGLLFSFRISEETNNKDMP